MTIHDDSTDNKLDFPYLIVTPFEVMADENLNGDVKLYFGVLSTLARREGYCWAKDEDLAQLYKKNVSTIKRWNAELEKFGYIERETINVSYRDEQGRLLWKKKRKIWVNGGFSKKSSDRRKNETFDERLTNEPYKNNTLNEDKDNNNMSHSPPAKEPDPPPERRVVVVFPPLEDLNIPHDLRIQLTEKYDEAKLCKLVERIRRWERRESDLRALHTILDRWDVWNDNPTESEIKATESDFRKKVENEAMDRKEQVEQIKAKHPELPWKICLDRIEIKTTKGIHVLGYNDPQLDDIIRRYHQNEPTPSEDRAGSKDRA